MASAQLPAPTLTAAERECRYTDLLITVHGTYRHAELEGEAPTTTQACQAVPKARSQR